MDPVRNCKLIIQLVRHNYLLFAVRCDELLVCGTAMARSMFTLFPTPFYRLLWNNRWVRDHVAARHVYMGDVGCHVLAEVYGWSSARVWDNGMGNLRGLMSLILPFLLTSGVLSVCSPRTPTSGPTTTMCT